MARVITGDALRALVAGGTILRDAVLENADGVKYDFRMGEQMLKAKHGVPVRVDDVDKRDLVVEPGEVVFVISRESLALPNNYFAQLSPKRSLSQLGIVVLGGFEIDPGYRGHLLMGLYNLSSSPFRLQPGRKLIAATFYEFVDEHLSDDFVAPAELNDFPEALVQMMGRYVPVSNNALAEEVQAMRLELRNLASESDKHNAWYERFESSLDETKQLVNDVARSLQDEREQRITGLGKLTSRMNYILGVTAVLIAIFGVLLGTALTSK